MMIPAHLGATRRQLLQPLLGRFVAAAGSLPTIVVRSTLTHLLLQRVGISPSWGKPGLDALVPLVVAACVLYGVVGGYVAMRLGAERSVRHVLALGVLGLGLSLAAAPGGGTPEPTRVVMVRADRSHAFAQRAFRPR